MNKRIFIAFPLPQEVRGHLGEVAGAMAKTTAPDEFVRWVSPEGMHLTAHFLGDLDEEAIRKVAEVCKEAAGEFRPAKVRLGRPDWFPENGPPRVVTVSVIEDEGFVLRQLQAALGRKLERQGIDVDHRLWTPHVTLGRVKTRLDPAKIAGEVKPIEFTIGSIDLLESQLTSDGALYSPIDEFPLRAD